MDGVGPDDLNTAQLLDRVSGKEVNEVILALGATLEGDTTAFYLNRRLSETNIQVSTIARGISVGGDLDQADELTPVSYTHLTLPTSDLV